MSGNTIRAGIYARISDDREGQGLGVERQIADCRAKAAALGWTVTRVFSDNDLSASGLRARKVTRPDYEALLDAIREREIDALVVWDIDRLTRKPIELEVIIALAETVGLKFASCGGEVDLGTPQGQLTARIKGNVARHEAQQIQRRIRSKVEELATAGKIGNGGPRPFGYTRVFAGEGPRRKILRDEVNAQEAEIIRNCVEQYLAGASLRSIVGKLNTAGVRTSTGRHWTGQALRYLLRSGRIAGLREHRRQVVATADWPAIIDVDTHRILRAKLDQNDRPPGARVRIHYLSGYVRCGACDAVMRVKSRSGKHSRLTYACLPKAEGGCNGRTVDLLELEAFVGAYVVGRLSDPDRLRQLAAMEAEVDDDADRLLRRIDDDEQRAAALQIALEDGDPAEIPELAASLRTVRRRIAAARADLSQRVGLPAIAAEDLPDLAARWEELTLDAHRAVLALLVDRIVIGPGERGKFDGRRVNIIDRRKVSPTKDTSRE